MKSFHMNRDEKRRVFGSLFKHRGECFYTPWGVRSHTAWGVCSLTVLWGKRSHNVGSVFTYRRNCVHTMGSVYTPQAVCLHTVRSVFRPSYFIFRDLLCVLYS